MNDASLRLTFGKALPEPPLPKKRRRTAVRRKRKPPPQTIGQAFRKAVGRLDDFLRERWRAMGLFGKSDDAKTVVALEDDAERTVEHTPINQELLRGHADHYRGDIEPTGIPMMNEQHAGAVEVNEHDSPDERHAEIEEMTTRQADDPLGKAYEIRQQLQKAIELIDVRLAENIDEDARQRLLDQHLTCLIKADGLTGMIAQAEQARRTRR